MRLARRLALCALIVTGLSGCIGIQSTTTTQPASMGPVRLTTTVCSTGSPGCAATTNTGSLYALLDDANSDTSVPIQVLHAVRLPVGTTPPETLTATLSGGGTLGFSRSPSLEERLQTLEPAPAGERWWGWLSSPYAYSRTSKQGLSVTVETALPRPADNGAYPSPLHWRPVVGARLVEADLPADRPVACGDTNDDLYDGIDERATNSATPTVVCVDSPDPGGTRGFLEAPVTDFGLTATAPTKVPPGSTVGVVFEARRTGPADAATTFALAVAGGPPGAALTLDRTDVPLGTDNARPVVVTVAVPPATAAGSYPITLDATATGKPARTATAELVVEPVATPAPAQTPGPAPTAVPTAPPDTTAPTLSRVTLRGKRVRFTLSEAATVTVRVGGRRARKALAGGKRSLKLPSFKRKPGRYTVRVAATDSAGNRSAVKRVRLKVKKKR